ncbi:hypothetical protein PT974_08506 [Cladobotryum mycophilum]|uniref:Uncharacterized protein n=1 Tax=Cladobotryum mycophilum TaxID=491253 RepID=A0ABR0SEM0_9HYPO
MQGHGGNLQVFMRRNLATCLGWHCLTPAEHFGIIFSSVVVFVILSVAYMYYLGTATISNRDRTLANLPGGRRTRRGHAARLDEVVPANDYSHPLESYPPRIVYQPIMYNLGGVQVPSIQPLAAIPSHPQAFPRMTQPASVPTQHHAYQEAIPRQAEWPPTIPTPQVVPPTSPASEMQSQESSWRQRLNRVFRIPVGRASTIASSSASGTPQKRSSHSIPQDLDQTTSPRQYRHREDARRPIANRSVQPSFDPSAAARENTASDESQSVRTDAATVHSDDFEMVNGPSSPFPREVETSNWRTGNHLLRVNGDAGTMRRVDNSSGTGSDLFSIPSVSSIQAGGVPSHVNDRLTGGRHWT